jgi:hypothetical protein
LIEKADNRLSFRMSSDCFAAPTCPIWGEVCALRTYKFQAEARITELEATLARISADAQRPSASRPKYEYRRSFDQLQAIESELAQVSSENTKLKSRLKRSQDELGNGRHSHNQ